MLGYFARFVFMLSPLVGFSMVAQAEDVSIVLRVSPQRVNVGDTLQATIEVEGAQGDDIEMPDFDGFEIVSRQVHSSVQVQFGFGSGKKIQPSLVYRLTLRALEPGNFVIGPARVSGNQAHSETQRVVVGSNPGASSAVPQHAAPTQEPPAATDADPIAFLRTVVTPQQPFVGQQITVSIYLYSRRPIVDHGVRAEKPEMQGFWVHDLSAESRPLRTQIGNKTYRVYEVLRYAAFPLRDGPLQIGSSSASIVTGGLGFFEPTRQIERSAPSVNV